MHDKVLCRSGTLNSVYIHVFPPLSSKRLARWSFGFLRRSSGVFGRTHFYLIELASQSEKKVSVVQHHLRM